MDHKIGQNSKSCFSLPSHLLRAKNPSSKGWTRLTPRSRTNSVSSWNEEDTGSLPNNILFCVRAQPRHAGSPRMNN